MLSIAQITDLHISSNKYPKLHARNIARLKAVLESIEARKPRPVAIIASGDLTDHGEVQEYRELDALLRGVSVPVHFGLGNHDRRAPFRECFPRTPSDPSGFVQYTANAGALKIIICDTLDEGRDGAAFCTERASWLRATLAAHADAPTLVALHHPPVPSGIGWMDPEPGASWLAQLESALAGQHQVLSLICGHVHRAFSGTFAGRRVTVSTATAPQLALDLSPMDIDVPDGRAIAVDEPPGYALHVWDGKNLVTHSCVVGDFKPVFLFKAPFLAGNA
ncbi:MAG: phosphodiesterase [Alphaproteobacteria bacterium]|nr:phosphodiesterase [Alphaproteobacteria bacterium]